MVRIKLSHWTKKILLAAGARPANVVRHQGVVQFEGIKGTFIIVGVEYNTRGELNISCLAEEEFAKRYRKEP